MAAGTAGLGTAVKALKIGDKIIELIPGKKVPDADVPDAHGTPDVPDAPNGKTNPPNSGQADAPNTDTDAPDTPSGDKPDTDTDTDAPDAPNPGPASTPINVIKIEAGKATKGTPEFELLNNPPPNSRIELDNGNVYITNAHGFVEEVTFHPRLVKEARDSRQTEVGKQGLDTDVGGHIQACSLGGTCDRVNLFPQDANFNNKEYKTFENEIRRALEAGEDVGPISVKFSRVDPSNPRPDTVEISYVRNGESVTVPYLNEKGGGL